MAKCHTPYRSLKMFNITARKLREGQLLFYEHASMNKVVGLQDSKQVGAWKWTFTPVTRELTSDEWAQYVREYLTFAQSVHKVSDAFKADLSSLLDALRLPAPKTRAFLKDPVRGALSQSDVEYIVKQVRAASSGGPMPVTHGPDTPLEIAFVGGMAIASPTKGKLHMTSPPGDKRGSGFHKGVDIAMPVGTPLYAVDNGVVTNMENPGGYGHYLMLETPYGSFVYGHLSEFAVKSGSKVIAGQLIAKSGNSGHSSGPHLHFEARKLPNGRRRATDADMHNTALWVKEAKARGLFTQ